jgi:hypothetical protein
MNKKAMSDLYSGNASTTPILFQDPIPVTDNVTAKKHSNSRFQASTLDEPVLDTIVSSSRSTQSSQKLSLFIRNLYVFCLSL